MRFGVATLALMLLARTAAGAAPASGDRSTLEALLARVRAASGAPYARHIVSESHETIDGRTFDVRSESEGYRFLERRCREVVCEGNYFNGELAFVVNINDTALPGSLRPDDEERTVRAIATCAFASPEFRAAGGTVSELPGVQRNQRELRRLAVATFGAGPLDVLIDPLTALPIEATSSDGQTAFEYRDFRHVDGLTIPFEVWHDGTLVERYETRTVVRAPLRPPGGLSPTFDGATTAIPMQRAGDGGPSGLPGVPCSIGDVAARCLIDTGNSALGMSLELAERLGLEPSGEFEVAGMGRYVTGLVTGGALRVGNATFPPAKYVVLHDLHEYGYDVVLGADALANTRVVVDYAGRTVTFAPAGGSRGDATIPLRFENFVPVVGVQLGAFDVPLALDTGDEAAVNVSYAYFSEHPGLFAPRGSRQVGGIGGSGEQIVGEVPSVRIATFDVAHQPIAATRGGQSTASGHLGSGFLGHFTVILDYARARMGLVPRAGDSAVKTVP